MPSSESAGPRVVPSSKSGEIPPAVGSAEPTGAEGLTAAAEAEGSTPATDMPVVLIVVPASLVCCPACPFWETGGGLGMAGGRLAAGLAAGWT